MRCARKKLKHGLMSLYRMLLLTGLSVIILYPLMYSISVALRPVKELYDPLVILVPRHLTLVNIKKVIDYMNFFESLINSLVRDFGSCFLQLLSCSLAGYGLARYRFKGRGIIFFLVILVIIVPPQTFIIPNYVNFRYFDPLGLVSLWNSVTGQNVTISLINKNMSFFLPAAFGMGIRSGFIIFIFRQFFRGMPKELEDAAYIDGCGPVKTYFRVMLPNASSAIITSFLLSLVWYWNDYVYTSSLMGNSKTVMNQLNQLYTNISHIMEYDQKASLYEGILLLQSGVLLAILPPLILYIIFQRYFTESIERSGIVG